MKFLLDVNASRIAAEWLEDWGHEVVSVAETDPQMSDENILEWARRERLVILTTDRDFEEMIWRENRPHCGVLRLENLPRAARRVLLEATLAAHEQDLADGAIVIASRSKIRVRRPNP